MELIQTITVGAGGAAAIEFPSIPATYDDLYVLTSLRTSTVNADIGIKLNGSTANFSNRYLFGNGSSASSGSAIGNFIGTTSRSDMTASTFGNVGIYIPNYRLAAAKSISSDSVSENNGTLAHQVISAILWNDTAAVTSLALYSVFGGNLVEHSSASLYGIRRFNTTTQPKATGGAISYDAVNQKWVHVFTASGTFTPTQNLTGVEYLVVAGGGGGGVNAAGGGGAGGYRSSVIGQSSGGGASAEATLSLTSGVAQTVTIGAGGAFGTGSNGNDIQPGSDGSNSVFGSITSTGGGGGAAGGNIAGSQVLTRHTGRVGGSGGGSTAYAPDGTAGPVAGGAGTTSQGFSGGTATSSGNGIASAGGGGAGGAGQSVSAGSGATAAGSGGSGVASTITGTSVTRASGGSAWTASPVAGGGGGSGQAAGQSNTGGGGGDGGNGGSGIVIVRYS